MTLTFMTAFSIQDISPFTQRKKVCSSDGRTLAYWAFFSYLCTSNRKKASLVPDVGLNRRQAPVVNNDPNKGKKRGFWGIEISTIKTHKSMINYSITMRSVNSNLLAINQAKSRINQAKTRG